MEIRDVNIIKRKEMFNFGGVNFINDLNGHNILKGESLRKNNVQNILLQKRFKIISEIQNEDNDEKILINSNLIKILEINEIISLFNNQKVNENKLFLFQSIYSLNKLSSSNLNYVNDIIINNKIHEEIFKILNKYSNNEIDYLDRLTIKHSLSLLNNLFYILSGIYSFQGCTRSLIILLSIFSSSSLHSAEFRSIFVGVLISCQPYCSSMFIP